MNFERIKPMWYKWFKFLFVKVGKYMKEDFRVGENNLPPFI